MAPGSKHWLPTLNPWGSGVLILMGFLALASCQVKEDAASRENDDLAGELIIFHAGSLSVPFRKVSQLFMEKHPLVQVKAEAAGSLDTARKVSDLDRPCDVFGSADEKVVENLLMPKYADFNIRFATNEMVIAYTGQSAMSQIVTPENWPDVLTRDDVVLGRADPNRDPCGYRTVMAFQLAEKQYRMPGLAKRLEDKHDFRYIRPKETDLLALMEAGEIDYMFIYRSVAVQHQLSMITLPDEVNLKSSEYAQQYRNAVVEVAGGKPGEFTTCHGAPMCYSVTIPKNSPHRRLAEAYVALLLSAEGRAIMETSGQPANDPPLASGYDDLPETLKSLCQPMALDR